MVLYGESDYIVKGIKHAQRLDTPSDQFGHFWYDYFDISFWSQAITKFLDSTTPHAKL